MPRRTKLAPSDTLDAEAVIEWERICSAVEKTGRKFKEADRAVLETYVRTWQIWRKTWDQLQSEGAVIVHHNKVTGTNPAFKVYKDLTVMLRGLLADLGCTPASRDFDVDEKKAKDRGTGRLVF